MTMEEKMTIKDEIGHIKRRIARYTERLNELERILAMDECAEWNEAGAQLGESGLSAPRCKRDRRYE